METNNQNLQSPTPSQVPQEVKKWYKHKGLIAVALLVIIATAVSYLSLNRKDVGQICPAVIYGEYKNPITGETKTFGGCDMPPADWVKVVNKNDNTSSLQPVPAGWEDYRNDVLGLSFSYPPEWGNISTYPSESITGLEVLSSRITSEFLNSIDLIFKNAGRKISIYSEQHGGRNYTSPPYGPLDNVTTLKDAKDACNYKINYKQTDYLQEIFSDCRSGIKIAVVENTQDFGSPTGILYTYSLNYYGFKKLENGVFDYLLTSHAATSTRQQSKHLTAEEFLNQAGIKKDAYPNMTEFTAFVQSLKSYPPPVVETPVFTVPEGEDSNITLIRKYYYQIATGQLNDAYKQLINPYLSQEKFNETYQNTYKIQPRDFKKLAENRYECWVDYQGHNRDAEKHRLIVQIINGKIKQELFDVLTSSIITFGDFKAYAASRGDENIVVLRQNGNESIIDFAPNDFDKTLKTLIFVDVSFSPQGNYLMYVGGGWEWAYLRIYDIKNKKMALETSGGHGEFSPSESIYFFCEANEMGGNYAATVYKVPEFSVKVDLPKQHSEELKDFSNITCSADEKNRLIHFNFNGKYVKDGNYDENASKTYNVNLDTGEVVN